MASSEAVRKLTAVFVTDVTGYSRLMGDDHDATVKTLAEYRTVFSEHIQQHKGRVVNAPGDSILAEFSSVVDAVSCAVDIQRELAKRNAKLAENRLMQFFDVRLSVNRSKSCASCHNPKLGFGDGMDKGRGARGHPLPRNTPHLYNLAWNRVFLWDGRAKSLEAQAIMPITNPAEMGMTIKGVAAALGKVPWYAARFRLLFPGQPIGRETLGAALAGFVRTIITRNSAFDHHLRGEKGALGPDALRGLDLFRVKANCVACHDGPNFTDGRFHNNGVLNGDPGMGRFSGNPVTAGAFKTPGLRNAALTAPYMHDGSMGTLEEVVRHYNRGGGQGAPIIRPLGLTESEIGDLVAFLNSLTEELDVQTPEVP